MESMNPPLLLSFAISINSTSRGAYTQVSLRYSLEIFSVMELDLIKQFIYLVSKITNYNRLGQHTSATFFCESQQSKLFYIIKSKVDDMSPGLDY